MYIVSREGSPAQVPGTIEVIDALTGTDLPDVTNYTGVTGGLFALSDVEMSSNGTILACNMTTNANTIPFKVYRWNNETAVPTVYIDFTAPEGVRLGDAFTVVGDITGNAVITAGGLAVSPATGARVVRWIVTGGVLGTPTVITLADTHGGVLVAQPETISANPVLFVNSNGQPIRKYNANGTSAGETLSIVGGSSNDFKYFELGTKKYMTVWLYGPGTVGELATLVDVTAGLGAAATIALTPKLGLNTNGGGTGGVSFRATPDATVGGNNHTITVFVLGTNNGISGTTLLNAGVTLNTAINLSDTSAAKIFPNPAGNEFQINISSSIDKNAQMTLFDINGRQVKSFNLSNQLQTISIEDLSIGMYLVKVRNGDSQSTIKLLKN
jgi:hypothetical protein